MSGKHARLSASSAHRWLVCAGSVEASAGKDTTSQAAATGTFAHGIAASCLHDGSLTPTNYLLQREKVDGFDVVCDMEMVDAIDLYIDEVNGDFQEGDKLFVEMPLLKALQTIDKDLGGTADAVRYRPSTKHLRVYDFKYGSGVYVEADDNRQLMIYALGAMLTVGAPVTDVEVVIVQPRFEGAKPVRSWPFKALDILDFVADAQEAADRSRQKDAPLVAGDHCTFCPAARTCPELEKREHALTLARFDSVLPYNVQALANALVDIPLVKLRMKAIEEFAYAEALRGVAIPGFKLVDKIARRRWKSEEEIVKWATERAIDPYEPRVVASPAQIEKKIAETAPKGKKKESGKVLEPFVEKVSSGTALVPVDDNRAPAKVVSIEDFAVIEGHASKKEVSPLSF